MQMLNDDSSTKNSSRPSDDNQLNPDLELQAVDPKTQEISKFLTSTQNNYYARHFGNNCVFCFRRNEPLFTLGPHCKDNIYFNFIF